MAQLQEANYLNKQKEMLLTGITVSIIIANTFG